MGVLKHLYSTVTSIVNCMIKMSNFGKEIKVELIYSVLMLQSWALEHGYNSEVQLGSQGNLKPILKGEISRRMFFKDQKIY